MIFVLISLQFLVFDTRMECEMHGKCLMATSEDICFDEEIVSYQGWNFECLEYFEYEKENQNEKN